MVQNSKYTDNDRLNTNTSSVFLSPSPSSKTLKTYQMDDQTKNIQESDILYSSKKRTNNCNTAKVRNVAGNNEKCTRVAIQVSKSGIIEVISDMETMV